MRVLADGAANRIYDGPEEVSVRSKSKTEAREEVLPDAVVGDLDSIREDVKRYYRQRDVHVLDQSDDQDSTDLMKSLAFVKEEMERKGWRTKEYTVAVVGAFGGRLDHVLGHLNILYQYRDMDLVLLDNCSLAMLLEEGTTTIDIDEQCEGPTCGLIPLGSAETRANTTGLVWNLNKEKHVLKFGGLVSSCNKLDGKIVTVDADGPLLWTSELRCDGCCE